MAVLLGIDRCSQENFSLLKGKRVGLITNHSGRDSNGRSTIDLLYNANGVKLTALFTPEHGLRGVADDAVSDAHDPITGLPIYSLYGTRLRPQPEQLLEVNVLVYDIQDIGVRFYTYISTLKYAIEAAAEAQIAFLVLDRPNPLGGQQIEGPLADADRLDFTACHPIPIRHGLTLGELATLYVRELKLPLQLDVVRLEGWKRSDYWDATNLTWINPSPNMRSLRQALLYPGIGLLEFTNLSVGRGTDTPFEWIGAPWIDARKLAAALNAASLPGVCFIPVQFQPSTRQYAGQTCSGVEIIVTHREVFRPVRTGLTIALALRQLFPEHWEPENYLRLLANQKVFQAIIQGAPKEEIFTMLEEDEQAFRERIAACLLY
ncbi:hypothetical protein CTKA_00687 [Chthonomonas calidirosea]|uniref:Uncharacterized protein conserved in bacteria n=1 Tax=Chthonomonas calidirosea (strain DSM 23976 / ICMP 18418 / T49) TaxID=1303518 RepID=S0EWZ6_CHTCT|nr:DUF1343 domain-containing protein [Chthonomonas calidirosea]CCW34303.1 Uncharacterized protein conserved in bacteria [Chthonomonas calidirosea T49]CEK15163.1 hypothetical protein CTKA_00687 [Chthonomonas calidirosea]